MYLSLGDMATFSISYFGYFTYSIVLHIGECEIQKCTLASCCKKSSSFGALFRILWAVFVVLLTVLNQNHKIQFNVSRLLESWCHRFQFIRWKYDLRHLIQESILNLHVYWKNHNQTKNNFVTVSFDQTRCYFSVHWTENSL